MVAVLIVPGLNNSPEGHWQTWLQQSLPQARRVEQDDWTQPSLDAWLGRLVAGIIAAPNAILVAHSLGCVLVAHAASLFPNLPVRGALLVAPADVDAETPAPDQLRSFAPVPVGRLPFRSVVVASTNDPYIALHRAEALATMWGSQFRNIGAAGHINVASGHGAWPAARAIVDDLANASSDAAQHGSIRLARQTVGR